MRRWTVDNYCATYYGLVVLSQHYGDLLRQDLPTCLIPLKQLKQYDMRTFWLEWILAIGKDVVSKNAGPYIKMVRVWRTDMTATQITHYLYVWVGILHPDEADWTEKEIEEFYAPRALLVQTRKRR